MRNNKAGIFSRIHYQRLCHIELKEAKCWNHTSNILYMDYNNHKKILSSFQVQIIGAVYWMIKVKEVCFHSYREIKIM